MNGQFDFLIVGDDEASLVAAAAAAKAGARVGLLAPADRRKRARAAAPAIPNFVWRRLDLQDYDLTLEPVSARITLFSDGEPISSFANARETAEALAESDSPDHLIWRDFLDDMAALAADHVYGPSGFARAVNGSGAPSPDSKTFAALLSDPAALDRAARLFGPCTDILEDYFSDARLKTHLAAHALGGVGRGEREAGSAALLTELLDPDAWRVRTPKDGPALSVVLEQVCQDAGVEISADKPTQIVGAGKFATVSFGEEEKARVKHIFFATPDAARLAGAADRRGGLGQAAHADFIVRFRLNEGAEPPCGDARAIFQIIDDREDLQAARDAALQGRLFDNLPVEFEFASNGEVIARSSFLPAAFYEEGEWRGWTGQDRQAVAAIIKDRLASRMPGFASLIRRTETELGAPPVGASIFAGCDRVIVQPRRHNAISAAVKLIDQVMAGDE